MNRFALYIDPGTGSMLISALIATLSVIFFALKGKIYTLFDKKGERGDRLDPTKHHRLVYYSEGKQYWNVFKPLLEEGAKRSIEAVYLTSDLEDPGLKVEIDGVQAIYIGTGREAYYNLNRLNADLVVMTTPGLDVLEIKRSKNVKHYCHITHATSSSATYKTYATDYYDSVLVGGEGVFDLIRELEENRNLPPKDIVIIGHTYLDVLRDRLQEEKFEYEYFAEKKRTVLVSPTWGDHGLLAKYGEKLLSALDEANRFNVVIRPHPQSFVSEKNLMQDLMDKFPDNKNRLWDTERENLKAMFHADIMISDFSGIIFDYFTLFKRPILTLRSQYEKRGREAMDLKDEPWDLQILDKIGKTLESDDIANIADIIDDTIDRYDFAADMTGGINNLVDKYPGESASRGLNFLERILESLIENELPSSVSEEKRNKHLAEDYTFTAGTGQKLPSLLLKLIKTIFDTGVLLQIIISCGLLIAYAYFGMKILPSPGLNADYLDLLKFYLIRVVIVLTALFLAKIWLFDRAGFSYHKKFESFDVKEIALIVLPLAPVVQYVFANQDILGFSDSFIVLAVFTLIAIVFVTIIPWLLSPLLAKIFTIPVSLSFVFIVLNMASFGKLTSRRTITILLFAIIIISFILLFIKKKKLLIILTLVFFVANSTVAFYKTVTNSEDTLSTEAMGSKIFEHTAGKEPINYPDIFIMIYDAYANQETHDAYGYDNSEQISYLLDIGFVIYDGTYSLGPCSISSMSQVLHVETLKGSTEFRRMIAGDAAGLKFLKDNGYKNHLLVTSDYYTKGFEPQYDTVYPPLKDSIASYLIISSAILEGEFRFDVEFSTMVYDEMLERKERVLSQRLKEPEFLYHHLLKPGHSQNSGVLLPDETERHIRKLIEANAEMKKDIADINIDEREAIVIIAGDHGPYLTKNGIGLGDDYPLSEVDRLDIQDRFGAFLAIYWPDPSYATRYEIRTIQDVLPAVIAYMYEDDSLFEKTKMANIVAPSNTISQASIENGIIVGGIDDGKPLFENVGIRIKTDAMD